MPCLICGNAKTVEAHIIPRALYRIIAGEHQHGYESSRFKAGVKYQAKGLFDSNILCSSHEAMLGEADSYGIEFIKSFNTAGSVALNGRALLLPNPKPALLVKFVASLIWRRGVSQVQREYADLDLGPAEPKLRALLFSGETRYNPPIIVSKRPLMSQGELLRELMFEPAKHGEWGHNSWYFYALGIEFIIKLNPYSSQPFPYAYLANDKTGVLAHIHQPLEADKMDGFMDLTMNMFRDPKTGNYRELI